MAKNGIYYKNYFITKNLNRLTEKRKDSVWLKKRLSDSRSHFILTKDFKNLFRMDDRPIPVYFSKNIHDHIKIEPESAIFLGEQNEKYYFVIDISSCKILADIDFEHFGKFRDIKQVAPLLKAEDSALLTYARAVTYWHFRNNFCGKCGSKTIAKDGGFLRLCTNDLCGLEHFPSTDSAVIVLVTYEDKSLLGRKSWWPKSMYSVLAGFVEPGESIEDALSREVFEESGVNVKKIKYTSSQPWPFPASLMLAFSAEAFNDSLV